MMCEEFGLRFDPLPPLRPRDEKVPHAPVRNHGLTTGRDRRQAVKNALRYFPKELHEQLGQEFLNELDVYGHIYMYRFKPAEEICAKPVNTYPAKCRQAAGVMLMIQNNLDKAVAQFPHELITYGGNGSVFQNWAQYQLTMKYLSEMHEDQTLVMYSGHPMGLFPSSPEAPRVVITNGLVIPNYSSTEWYNRLYALGHTQFGQMTAGSYAYIGPQGIVHGTTITLLNAGRKYLNVDNLAGKVFVTAGLGGMSGAQPKASVIAGGVCIVAELNPAALFKRKEQGWVEEASSDLEEVVQLAKKYKNAKKAISIGYLGNIVELWERLAQEDENLVELGSDQTSSHNIFGGGYWPAGFSIEDATKMLETDPGRFKEEVEKTLRRHVAAVNKLTSKGMRFWDYGNAFLLEASRAKAEVMSEDGYDFRYPSYFEDIMGDIFSLGFGPFRWVCLSGDPLDLQITDELAANVLTELGKTCIPEAAQQYADNVRWIQGAAEAKLVVGSQARIMYADQRGRKAVAKAFNDAVQSGRLKGPVAISRDHHDVSGTDSPFRETANVTDGSKFCADMATQTFVGNAFRGATWVSLHNGGGVGWGEVINGGFGLILDGTQQADSRASAMLEWDTSNGMARRCWSENENARKGVEQAMRDNDRLTVTLPTFADEAFLRKLVPDSRL